jgi:hypothetical protein
MRRARREEPYPPPPRTHVADHDPLVRFVPFFPLVFRGVRPSVPVDHLSLTRDNERDGKKPDATPYHASREKVQTDRGPSHPVVGGIVKDPHFFIFQLIDL